MIGGPSAAWRVGVGHVSTQFAYRDVITIEPGKRGGRPVIRGSRVAVSDVLGWLSVGMSYDEILSDFPDVTEADIRAALAFAADRERQTLVAAE